MGWALQRPLLLLLLLLLLQSACVLGGGNQGSSQPGYSTSTSCTATSQCSSSAANYISRSLTYAPATGLFSGTITANGCPETITTFALGTPTCVFTTSGQPEWTPQLPRKLARGRPFLGHGHPVDRASCRSPRATHVAVGEHPRCQ